MSNWEKLKKPHRGVKRKRHSSITSSTPSTPVPPTASTVTMARASTLTDLLLFHLPSTPTPPANTTFVALDCEMVGVGPMGSESALARVSLVSWTGEVLYDKFVKPKEKVTDYRTWVSGIREDDLRGEQCVTLEEAQKVIGGYLSGELDGGIKGGKNFAKKKKKKVVLVGHAVWNDLQALFLSHPRAMIRDTQTFPPLRKVAGTKIPALRVLVKKVLDIDGFQRLNDGEHSSVDDARATMAVYRKFHKQWETGSWKDEFGVNEKAKTESSGQFQGRPKTLGLAQAKMLMDSNLKLNVMMEGEEKEVILTKKTIPKLSRSASMQSLKGKSFKGEVEEHKRKKRRSVTEDAWWDE